MLHNILLKIDEQYNPILNGYYAKKYPSKNAWQPILDESCTKNNFPKMDDQYNSISDEYYDK